jgi:hypothetical protein
MRLWQVTLILLLSGWAGCGSTRWSDSSRTATEQLLISGAIDRSVSSLDFRALAGKTVYFDTTCIKSTIDADYVASSLRQHALASGCIVKTKAEEADYIAEVRAGTVGTDRHDVLFGIPSASIPTSTTGSTTSIPEIPFVKKTDQRAVAKLAVFAYNRYTGRPIWQSGTAPFETKTKDVWVFGTGPFQKGDIHKEMKFAGEKLPIPVLEPGEKNESLGQVSVTAEAYFNEPKESTELARRLRAESTQPVQPQPTLPMQTFPPSGAGAMPTQTPGMQGGQTFTQPNSNQGTSVQTQGNGFSSPSSSQPTGATTTTKSTTIKISEWPFSVK